MFKRAALITLSLAWSTFAPAEEPAPPRVITVKPLHATTAAAISGDVLWVNTLNNDANAYTLSLALGAETKKVRGAYLGVGVESPSEALRSQLKLPEGVGLVVNYVDDNSPSRGVLHRHDVLEKIDDQLLVNAEQFVTLVRLHKPGDTVHLTLIREAARTTVDVKLAEKELPALSTFVGTNPIATQTAFSYWAIPTTQPIDRATLIRRLSLDLAGTTPSPEQVRGFVNDTSKDATKKLVDHLLEQPQFRDAVVQKWSTAATQPALTWTVDNYVTQAAGADIVSKSLRAGPVTIDDGEKLMWLRTAPDGSSELTVVDRATGAIDFKGPISNDDQWQKVPESIRQKFQAWRAAMEQKK